MAVALCSHLSKVTNVKEAKVRECSECVARGDRWLHLRTCQTCGATLCCDDPPNNTRRNSLRALHRRRASLLYRHSEQPFDAIVLRRPRTLAIGVPALPPAFLFAWLGTALQVTFAPGDRLAADGRRKPELPALRAAHVPQRQRLDLSERGRAAGRLNHTCPTLRGGPLRSADPSRSPPRSRSRRGGCIHRHRAVGRRAELGN